MTFARPMSSEPDAGEKSTSYLQIALTMLGQGGVAAVRAMRPEPSKHSAARAVHYLKQNKHDVRAEELARYVRHHWPLRKSKTKPSIGDVRLYRVLEQDGSRYARIPCEIFGAKKGDFVQVVFEEDKLTLRHIKMDEPMKYADARRAVAAKKKKVK